MNGKRHREIKIIQTQIYVPHLPNTAIVSFQSFLNYNAIQVEQDYWFIITGRKAKMPIKSVESNGRVQNNPGSNQDNNL